MPPKPPSWELTPDEMSALQAQLSTVSVTIAAVSDSLRSAQSVLTTAVNAVSVQLADEVASHVLWRKDVDDQIAAQYTRLSVNDARLTQLDSAVSALRAKDTQIDTTLANMASVNTTQAGQLTSVNNRVSALAAADAALLTRLQGDESQLSAVSVRTTTLNNALSALQVANAAASARITSLENALSAFKDEVSVALGKLIITQPQQSETLLTDTNTRTLPSLPSMGSSWGSTVVDPTFGTTIMRMTDSNDASGNSFSIGYAYWPTFNLDATRLFILATSNSQPYLITFNPSTFARSGALTFVGSLPQPWTGWTVRWSGSNADHLYAHTDVALHRYSVSGNSWTQIKDLSATLGSDDILQQSAGDDDDRWAFLTTAGYVVWDRGADTVRSDVTIANLEDVRVDKSGRYVITHFTDGTWEVWDYNNPSSPTSTGQGTTSPDTRYFHFDYGTANGFMMGYPLSDWKYRNLATPTSPVSNGAGLNVQNTNTQHYSMNANNEDWGLVSDYELTDGVTAFGHNEIFQVALDGSDRVRRICHHRSYATSSSPGNAIFANPTRSTYNGNQYVAFNSNWGNSGRTDIYVVRFQAAPTL